jgi:hypothetical protein
MSGYIYLIHCREFFNSGQPIYKIGKTEDTCCRKINKRFSGYEKDSVIKIIIQVSDMNKTENDLKHIFGQLFEKQPSIGTEYFRGKLRNMLIEISKFIPDDDMQEIPKIDYTQLENRIKGSYRSIFLECHGMQNKYNIQNVRNIYDTYNLTTLRDGAGSPTCKAPTIIEIDKIITALKKLYDKPTKGKIVTCENYHNLCGIMNTFARTNLSINNYEQIRLTMPNPKNYIQIKIKPLVEVSVDTYRANIKKCIDIKTNGAMYLQQFPF